MRSYAVPETSLQRAMRGRDGIAHESFDLRCLPIHQRERIQSNSGHKCDAQSWQQGRDAQDKLESITLTICERLKRCLDTTKGYYGANLYRPSTDGTLHVVCTVDDEAEEILAVKHQVFLPVVAHLERNALTKEFRKWMETHSHTRYYVVTAGQRCKINELSSRLRWLHVQLAEFRRLISTKPEFRGIEVVLRCDEFTIKRDGEGELTFHPHMNLAIHFPYVLGEKRFLLWKKLIDSHFGTMVKDCGEIREARELIKYVTKFESSNGELGVLDLQDTELTALYQVRRGMKPVQALGSFRRFRSGIRESRQKIVSRYDGEQWRLAIVPKPPVKPQRPSESDEPRKNVFVSLTEPQPRFKPILRPCVLVRNFDGDFTRLRKELNLEPLRNFVLAASERNAVRDVCASGVVPSWVHTSTETLEEVFDETPPVDVAWGDKPDLWWSPGSSGGEGPPD